MVNKRVAIIGLDGVPYNFINLARDLMPNVYMLASRGVHKLLYSILPPYTPPAWTSIATGVNPGKHGVFDFHIVRKTSTGFVSRIATALDVKYPRIHDMLEVHRMKSIVCNLPLTYPPWIAGGKHSIIINDWMAPEIRMHPRELESRYLHYFNKGLEALDLKGSSEESFRIMAERVEHVSAGLLELMDNTDWNLLFAVFSEPDWSMHGNTRIVRGDFTPESRRVFQKIDWFVRKVLDYTDNIIIVSDHGFTLCPYIVNPGYILKKHGLASEYKFSETMTLEIKGKKLRVPPAIMRFIRKHKKLKAFLRKLLFKTASSSSRERRREIPYHETKTIAPDAGIIYVAPGYKDEVKNLLLGRPEIKNVYEPRDLYWGPYVGNAPDLIIEPLHDYCIGTLTHKYITRQASMHNRDGIFILNLSDDNNVVKEALDKFDRLMLWDIVPLALYILGLPLPDDTDSVLLQILKGTKKENYLAKYKLMLKLRRIKPA